MHAITSAVVAHYDSCNQLDDNFLLLVQSLKTICSSVVVVTTSTILNSSKLTSLDITLIIRPNIGYDFYSYRAGIEYLQSTGIVDNLLLINSSIYLESQSRLISMLRHIRTNLSVEMPEIWGLTKSRQYFPHLQSFFIIANARVTHSKWWQTWWESVQPKDTKHEIIIDYEIGLSITAVQNNVLLKEVVSPSIISHSLACMRMIRYALLSPSIKGVQRLRLLRSTQNYNPSHFLASEISNIAGIVKKELVKSNPYKLNYYLPSSLQEFVKNTISQEKHCGYLTSLALPSYKLACFKSPSRTNVQYAVCLHLFYGDLIEELYELLGHICVPFDLFVTTPFESLTPAIIDRFESIAASVTVSVSENRGRDVGPFISLYRTGMLDSYKAVLKLHGKKSKYSSNGAHWRSQLFGQLCSSKRQVEQILDLFKDQTIGMVGPSKYYLCNDKYWGANQDTVRELARAVNVESVSGNFELGFFAGTMFWFNPKAFVKLHSIPDDLLHFEQENGKQDGTLAHAFERFFTILAKQEGFKNTALHLNALEIHSLKSYYLENSIPVL